MYGRTCGASASALAKFHARRPYSADATAAEAEDDEKPAPAPGLPVNDCLTYDQRYHWPLKAENTDDKRLLHSAKANAQHPDAKFALLMWMHVEDKGISNDLITYLRSLAHEVTSTPGNAYHFYIMLQRPRKSSGMNSPFQVLTREQMLAYLPFDLRQFTILHDFADVYPQYPALNLTGDWGPGKRAKYLSMAHFLDLYPAYEYLWITEYDLRYVGGNIGHYMNAAMRLAAMATDQELEAEKFRFINVTHSVPRSMPIDIDGLPDFLTVHSVEVNDKWRSTGQGMDFYARSYTSWTMLFMGSRRLFQKLQEHSLQNRGTDLEGFIPTVAMHEGLKVAAIPMLRHDKYGSDIMHCCQDKGPRLYAEWRKNRTSCLKGYFLHPVKNDDSLWGGA